MSEHEKISERPLLLGWLVGLLATLILIALAASLFVVIEVRHTQESSHSILKSEQAVLVRLKAEEKAAVKGSKTAEQILGKAQATVIVLERDQAAICAAIPRCVLPAPVNPTGSAS